MRTKENVIILRYGCALVSISLAIGGRLLLDPWLGKGFPFALPFLAILITAWLGGGGPAMVAMVVGGVATDYFLLDPRGSFGVTGSNAWGLALYCFTGLGIALLGGAMHSARVRAERNAVAARVANETLEARVRQRTDDIARSEARLAGIVETAMDGIISVDGEQNVVMFNRAAEKLFGCPAATAIGQPLARFIPERHREEHWKKVADFGQSGVSERAEKPLRGMRGLRGDGSEFPIEASISHLEVDGETISTAVVRDITQRNLAEAAAARLVAIVESSFDAIVGKDLNGVVNTWNAGAERMFGYGPAEILGQPITRLIPPNRLEEEDAILARIRRGEPVEHFETVRVKKSGDLIQVSVTVSPIRDTQGKVIGASKVARDITGRKEADAALREREEQLRLYAEHSPAAIALFDREMKYQVASRRWMEVYQLGEQNILGRSHYDVFPEMSEAWKAVHQRCLNGATEKCEEDAFVRADGVTHWIRWEIRPWHRADGNIGGIIIFSEDISARKHAETAMRESEERFRVLANSMSQLAWITRADGYIHWYNRRWYEYTGTTPEQMEGWGWQRVHDPKRLPEVMEKWAAALAAGQPFEMEFPLRGKDGKFRTFLTRGEPLRDVGGKVTQWFGTNTDVEAMKQAEKQIQQLNAELEERVRERTAQLEAANKELEAFSYSVSHDLRAPLRAVNGFAKIVLDEYGAEMAPGAKDYLEWIRAGGRQMGLLIDDLLAFARLGRQALKVVSVDMTALVEKVVQEAGRQAEGRPIDFQIGVLPRATGDPVLIRQVWVNLIDNAIKYTRGRAPAIITVGGENREGKFVYEVRDNGTGFDMKYAGRLFGVFQRLHRAEEFEGTGVGLAIVQRIIHRHGGQVWAEAEPGRGAVFRFTLGDGMTL